MFRRRDEPDPELREILIEPDARALKRLARSQDAIRGVLEDGERILAVAVWGQPVVSTNRRVFWMARSKVNVSIPREEISETAVAQVRGQDAWTVALRGATRKDGIVFQVSDAAEGWAFLLTAGQLPSGVSEEG